MTTVDASGQKLEIGRVIERTFAVIGRNLKSFSTALVIYAAPYFISQALVDPVERFSGLGLLGSLFGLVAMVAGLILQGGLIRATLGDLRGRVLGPRDVVNEGLEVAGMVLLVSIVFGFAVVFGMVLLVVPGVMLAVMWVSAVPAAAIERTDVVASLRRSAHLTKGDRWSILLLLVIYLLAASIVTVIAAGLTTGVFGLVGIVSLIGKVVGSVFSAAALMVGAVGSAVLYSELRAIKDGVSPEAVASVFD